MKDHPTAHVEATRKSFRPDRITTLFVGESAPISGDFFYFGDTQMTRYMRSAIEAAFGPTPDFLQAFKSYGWYLDDLVLVPVNHLKGRERKAALIGAQTSLASRIADYKPAAIVSLMVGIRDSVEAAALAATDAPRYVVAFPGNGQQGRFKREMSALLPRLPRNGGTNPPD